MLRSAIIDLVKVLRPSARDDVASAVRLLARRARSRKVLNSPYSLLPSQSKSSFHSRFSKVFREYQGDFSEGTWQLKVGQKPVLVPLRSNYAWLDWDAALSVLGHEPELKATYDFFISLKNPPQLVLDIGANYGTHSIIFLSHCIRTISFEPNTNCHAFFRLLCETNRLKYELEPLATGASEASVDLWYREREEWLGTTDSSLKFRAEGGLLKTTVSQTTIDRYVEKHRLESDVLKIDTEGTDFQVLLGGALTS